ncbi:cadherin-related family member 3 [Liasis olivaceus]
MENADQQTVVGGGSDLRIGFIMDGCILRKTQDGLCFCFIVLLIEISGGESLSFSGLPATGSVTENSAYGTVVHTFQVNLTPYFLPNISIPSGYPLIVNSNPLTKAFRINTISSLLYQVVTTGNPVLDYETMPHAFELQILVADTAGAIDLQILTVQVLDVNEPPVFQGNLATQTVVVYILENTSPGLIYQIHAADPEKTPSREIKFSLSPASPFFAVSPTGTISALKSFDFEKDPTSYTLNVTITDHLGVSVVRTLMVNIINTNDEDPYFTIKNNVFRIREEAPPGTFVANITATDPDGKDFIQSLRYSLGVPEGTPNFYINPITGMVLVAGRIDRDASPIKTHPNISLTIHVEDSLTHKGTAITEIFVMIDDINDNPPTCGQYNHWKIISEMDSPGLEIINLRNDCKDIDTESPNYLFNFTELSGVGSNKFTQDPPHSGIIKVCLIGNVDFENTTGGSVQRQYILNTVIRDVSWPYFSSEYQLSFLPPFCPIFFLEEEISLNGTCHSVSSFMFFLLAVFTELISIYIEIQPKNEFVPVFSRSLYIFNVSELEPFGSSIGGVLATDKDLPSTGISYSILYGESSEGVADLILIHPRSGILRNAKRLDYEENQRHFLMVQASDNDSGIGTSSVIINVLEANDEPPNCTPSSQLLNMPVDLSLGIIYGFSISCVDRDSSPRSFRYTITSGNVNNHFTFSPNAGSNISRLVFATPFDYETGLDRVWEYRLLVSVTDDNLLSSTERAAVHIRTGTVTLTIRVIPDPTTVIPTTPGVTIVTSKENVYASSAWYVPFFIVLGSLLLLGLLGYLAFLLAKYLRAHCPPRADTKPLIFQLTWRQQNSLKMLDRSSGCVLLSCSTLHPPPIDILLWPPEWEMTNLNPVFDGEAIDPVTGRLYEYNSKSGARRWKDTSVPSKTEVKDPAVRVTTPPKSHEGNRPKAEANTSGGKGDLKQKLRPPKSGERNQPKAEAETGDSQGDLKQKKPPKNDQTDDLFKIEDETRRQNHIEPRASDKTESFPNDNLKLQKPKEDPPGNRSSSTIPPRRSPIPSPKIYPKYQNQS